MTDLLTPALIQSMARTFTLIDLIRTAESLKQSGPERSVETLYAIWIQYNSDHPLLYAALFNYAVILSDSGNLPMARECLERALSLNAEFTPAYINLGRIYERLGATGAAVMQWSTVLEKLAAVTGTAIAHKTTALNQIARTLKLPTRMTSPKTGSDKAWNSTATNGKSPNIFWRCGNGNANGRWSRPGNGWGKKP
jgi:predicted O-linked N-acetylglucosamine transferase (SPINDLY family)